MERVVVFIGYGHAFNVERVGILIEDVSRLESLELRRSAGSCLVLDALGTRVAVDALSLFPIFSPSEGANTLEEMLNTFACGAFPLTLAGIDGDSFSPRTLEDDGSSISDRARREIAKRAPTREQWGHIGRVVFLASTWTEGEDMVGRPAGAITFINTYRGLVDEVWWRPPTVGNPWLEPGGPLFDGIRLGQPEVVPDGTTIRATMNGYVGRSVGAWMQPWEVNDDVVIHRSAP